MTIAVGILAGDSIVIAADSQETYPHAKVEGDKIMVLKSERPDIFGVLAFTGAGAAGYLDKCGQEVFRTFLDTKNETDLQQALQETIKGFYRQHVIPFGQRWAEDGGLEIQTIIAYERDGTQKLLSNVGTPLREVSPHVAVGTGESLVKGLLRELYRPDISREAAIRLAALAVYRAKDHDPNCGKRTEILVIRDGKWKQIDQRTIEQWERVFDRVGKVSSMAVRRMLGIKRSPSDISREELDAIEQTFTSSEAEWHFVTITPSSPVKVQSTRQARKAPKRVRKGQPASRG